MTFWEWFSRNAEQLTGAVEADRTHDVVAMMDAGAALLPDPLGWEVGPEGDGLMLALTLAGDLDNLPVAQQLIARAPKLEGWTFHAGRPPKDWDLRFELEDDGGEFKIDANGWKYGLVAFDGGRFFDVTIVTEEAVQLETERLELAAAMVLEGLLGEVRYLDAIDRIDVVARLEQEMPLTEIKYLRDHLDRVQGARLRN